MSEELPKKLNKPALHSFSVGEFGLYAVTITARCQPADLRIEIDEEQFREIPPEKKPQYNNIPPSWNGSQLQGKAKTVVFILQLNQGKHTIKFIPTGEVTIEQFSHKEIKDLQSIQFALENQAEDGDRRPWYTFALINLPLQSITADASVGWHWFDGDDVKLLIDNKVKQNVDSKLHKDWYWLASPLQIFSKPERKENTLTEKLKQGTHYIEFWADKTPTLHKVILNLGEVTLKRIPTSEDPEWTGNFADDTDRMILARVLFGEARSQLVPDDASIAIGWVIKNRVKSPRWANTYWEVITEPSQYSSFNNNDPNRRYVENPFQKPIEINKKVWDHTYEVAKKVISGELKDPTKGANHYYDDSITTPPWAKDVKPTLTITYKNQYGKNATIFFLKL